MAIINRVPKGFLGLLDAKTLGETPSETTGMLQPTVDLRKFYEFDLPLRDATATETGSFIGEFARVTVPDGEAWLVHVITAKATALASTSPYLSVRLGGPGVSQADVNQQRSGSLAVGEAVISDINFGGEGRLFTSGSFFACLNSNTIGNTQFITLVHYRRLVI